MKIAAVPDAMISATPCAQLLPATQPRNVVSAPANTMNSTSNPIPVSTKTSAWALPKWLAGFVALALLVIAVKVEAATERTWIGDGDTGIWSDVPNWSSSPVTGDILKFANPYNNIDCQNDIGALGRIGDMFISASGFSITGLPLQLGGNWTVQESATWGINSTVYQDIVINSWANKTLTFNGTVDLNGKILSMSGEGNIVLAGAISGDTGTFDVNGSATSGSCTLSAVNSYKGLTRLSAGTLKLGVNNAIPRVNSADNYIDFVGFLTSTLDLNGKNLAVNALVEQGYVKCNAGSATLTIGSSYSTFTSVAWGYAGSIQGPISLVKDGTSLFYLAPASAANSYSGDTWIQAGTLQLRADGSCLPYGAGKGNVLIDTGAFLDMRGAAAGVNGLSGAGKVINSHSETASILTVGNNDATSSFSGAIDDSGGTATLALTKTGSGTLTLSGTSTYRGITRVNAGKLTLTGALSSNGSVRVGSATTGGTLAGNGTIAGIVGIYGTGTIAPGSSVGILNTGAETWQSAGNYEFEINSATGSAGTSWDLLNISGALTVSATSVSKFTIKLISLNGTSPIANWNARTTWRWRIATGTSAVVGFSADKFTVDTSAFTTYTDIAGGSFTVENSTDTLGLDLVFTRNPVRANAASYGRAWGTFIRISIADLLANFTEGDSMARQLVSVATGNQSTIPHYSGDMTTGYILLAPAGNASEIFNYTVQGVGYPAHSATSTITVGVTNAVRTCDQINYSAGSVTLKFAGKPGFSYVVERSAAVEGTWAVVAGSATNLPSNVGVWVFTDSSPLSPSCYYRLRQNN